MPIVAMPDGNNVQFPDEMQPEQIKSLIATKFPAAAQPQANPDDLPQPGVKGTLDNIGRYQSENWDTAKNEVRNAITGTEFKPQVKDEGAVHEFFDKVGNSRVAHAISGIGGAIASPVASVASGVMNEVNSEAVKSVDPSSPIPQEELHKIHDVSGAEGGIVANTGMAMLGARAGIAGETEAMGSKLKSIRDIKSPINESATLVKANKGTVKDSLLGKGPDPTRAGESAIGKLNNSYESASKASEDAYTTLKAIPYKAQAPDFYTTADKLVNELSGKIAAGTDEDYALNNFKEIVSEAQSKYGSPGSPAGAPLNLQQILSGAKPPKAAVAATPATELSLPEAIEIKSGLNSLLDTLSSKREFSTSGMRSINQLKTSVQTFIDAAAKSDPKIKAAINTAEQAAYTKSQFKVPEMKDLWTQEDYNSFRAAKNNPDKPWLQGTSPGTTSRADSFLQNLNEKDAGTIKALINNLKPDDAVEVLHDAITKGRSDNPVLVNGRWILRDLAANTTPGVVGSRLLNPFPKETALIDLTKRAQDAARTSNVPTRTIQTGLAGSAADSETNQKALTKEQKNGKLKSPLKPQSLNEGKLNETPSITADTGTLPPKSDSGFSLKDLNPINEAEAATIKEPPASSPIAKNVKTFMDSRDNAPLQNAMKKYGVNPTEMMTLVNAESSVKSSTGNGYAQMTPGAWKQAEAVVGKKLDRDKPDDYAEASVAYYKWTREQVKKITNSPGQPPIHDVYPAYNAGVSGLQALKKAKPTAKAVDVVPQEVSDNNKAFYYDKSGKPLTVQQTLKAYKDFVSKKMDEYSPANATTSTKLALAQASTTNEPDM